MGILENTIGAMLGGQRGGGGARFEGSSPYAPLATALIGLLAAKAVTGGFGNLGGILGGGGGAAAPTPAAPGAGGTVASGVAPPQAANAGGGLLGGLGGLLHHFQQSGHGDVAQSWVGHGPNQPASPQQISQALGPETLDKLARQTGMSADQVAAQLSQALPDMIDRLTPNGRLPTHEEVSSYR